MSFSHGSLTEVRFRLLRVRCRFLLGEYSPAAPKAVSKTLFFRVKSSSLQTFPLNITIIPPARPSPGGGSDQSEDRSSRCFSDKQQLSGPRESRPSDATQLSVNHAPTQTSDL